MAEPAPIALVTGAGRGIGQAIAERLSRGGLRVALTARSEGELAATAGRCPRPTLVLPADVPRRIHADPERGLQAVVTGPFYGSAGDVAYTVSLSDYGTEGAAVTYKAWVCTNPGCGFNLKIHKGNLYVNEPVNERSTYNH